MRVPEELVVAALLEEDPAEDESVGPLLEKSTEEVVVPALLLLANAEDERAAELERAAEDELATAAEDDVSAAELLPLVADDDDVNAADDDPLVATEDVPELALPRELLLPPEELVAPLSSSSPEVQPARDAASAKQDRTPVHKRAIINHLVTPGLPANPGPGVTRWGRTPQCGVWQP